MEKDTLSVGAGENDASNRQAQEPSFGGIGRKQARASFFLAKGLVFAASYGPFGGVRMRRILFCLTILTVGDARIAHAQSHRVPTGALVVIRAGALIDGTSAAARKNQLIFVRGQRIEKVAEGSTQVPGDATVIDLSQATVLPGLIDSHTHIFLWGEDPNKGGYDANILKAGIALRAARATFACRRALEQGFTTLRDVETEGAGYGDVEIKQAIAEGTIPGPRLFCATRAISTTGGYNLEGYAPELDMPKGAQIVDGPVEARKAAREQLDHGADWIKVYMTHRSWVDPQGNLVSQPTLTVEELKAIVDETHGWGKRVACHAYNGIGLQRALDGGCDSIEHGLEITDAQIAQMARQGTWYCPTLSVYFTDWEPEDSPGGKRDRARAHVHEASFKKALQAHVKIVFGTDIGGMSWTEPIAQEFSQMVKLGMAPMDAIQAATSRPAEMLEMQREIGTIAAGAYADIVAVLGDPLKEIAILERVRFVMHDGAVFKNEFTK
jgi:imidazolonepropionase-like amidohydrolase